MKINMRPIAALVLVATLLPATLHAEVAAEPELTWGETAYCAAKGAVIGALAGGAEAGKAVALCLIEESED
jgi:hypothetical protein